MRRYVIVAAALLLVNRLVAGALYGGPERPTIAYSPLFLDQVQTGNVGGDRLDRHRQDLASEPHTAERSVRGG